MVKKDLDAMLGAELTGESVKEAPKKRGRKKKQDFGYEGTCYPIEQGLDIDDKGFVRVVTVYSQHKSVKGYMGRWVSNYKFIFAFDLYGNLLAPGFWLGDVNCIKKKGYREGDILELSVKLVQNADGSLKFTYPKDVVCHGRIKNAGESLFVLQATKTPQEIWAFLNTAIQG